MQLQDVVHDNFQLKEDANASLETFPLKCYLTSVTSVQMYDDANTSDDCLLSCFGGMCLFVLSLTSLIAAITYLT